MNVVIAVMLNIPFRAFSLWPLSPTLQFCKNKCIKIISNDSSMWNIFLSPIPSSAIFPCLQRSVRHVKQANVLYVPIFPYLHSPAKLLKSKQELVCRIFFLLFQS